MRSAVLFVGVEVPRTRSGGEDRRQGDKPQTGIQAMACARQCEFPGIEEAMDAYPEIIGQTVHGVLFLIEGGAFRFRAEG